MTANYDIVLFRGFLVDSDHTSTLIIPSEQNPIQREESHGKKVDISLLLPDKASTQNDLEDQNFL